MDRTQGATDHHSAAGSVTPVAALPYRLEDEPRWSPEVRLVLVIAAASAVFGLVTFATTIWIYLQPTNFRTVGSFQSPRSLEFVLSAVHALLNMAVIAGCAGLWARRRVSRSFLVAGSAGQLVSAAVAFVYYTFLDGNSQRYGADLLVWALWRVAWFIQNAAVPALTLVAMSRPHVRAWFQPRTGG